jgi:small-conductance mechanosensitive channel
MVLRALAFALVLAAAASGFAEAQTPLTLPSTAPSSALDIRQEGVYTTAPIVLDDTELFRVTAPGSAATAIAERVTVIEGALQGITSEIQVGNLTETAYDPATFTVTIVPVAGQAVLLAVDSRHREPVPIVTVTTTDAAYNLTTVAALAKIWQGILKPAIVQSLVQRQPAQLRLNIQRVLIATCVLLVLTLAVVAIVVALRRRVAALQTALEKRDESAPTAEGAGDEDVQHRRSQLLAFALGRVAPEQQLRVYGAVADLLIWLLVLLWFIGVTWAMSRFAQTATTAHELWHGALGVAGIWIVAALLNRAFDIAIQRAAAAWHVRYSTAPEERARQLLRVPTVANALSGFKTFLIVFLAALASLSQVGFSLGSVVTIGGIIALGVSLAAQNLIRDFVNGFLILFEDQFVVGDYVTINTESGLVENLTLRISQIRDAAGNLITIPHSSIVTVANHSRHWSRVDYVISADPAADPDAAVAAVRGAIESMAGDPDWRETLIVPVEWIGIDSVTKDWLAIRAAVRTAPLRQFAVRRELNARVVQAFHAAKLGFGLAIVGEDYYHS